MLRLQNIINASDTLSSSIRRKTLKNIFSTKNIIFRTHITSRKEHVLSACPVTNARQLVSNKLFFQNHNWLKVKEIHTHIISRCQSSITNAQKNIREDEKSDSEEQFEHPQMVNHEEILSEFPQPISSLNNMYSIIESQLKINNALSMKYKIHKDGWSCDCNVKWPEDRQITAIASSKKKAGTLVALQCLHWLKDIKKIKDGLPVVFDFNILRETLNRPTDIYVNNEMKLKLEELLSTYETTVKPIIMDEEISKVKDLNEDTDLNPLDEFRVTTSNRTYIINYPKHDREVRNHEQLLRLQQRKSPSYTLPIDSYKNEILRQIEKNQIILIKGETGCGKTTQVPQFIIDSFAEKGQFSDCNIIVTQPRRISATSLADRIARERGENLGDVVGFKVKLRQVLPQTPGAILFCTTGVLLKKMQSNRDLIGLSHLIIDEAHERSVDTDMMLGLLKQTVKRNKDLKVIIMSATLNADLFQNYFDCASLEIPGKSYPVKMHFLEDIRKKLDLRENIDQFSIGYPQVEFDHITKLLQWIHWNKPPGAILCFLPGWNEISQVEKLLKASNSGKTGQLVLPIHSLLSHHDQQKIFEKPPNNVRKIILATDIAETGITVPDVVYVVDSATHKEMRWDKKNEINSMKSHRISRANLHQRKGRAGRVQPGESYHMISKDEYDNLQDYPVSEIKRISLERVALDCKLCTNEKIEDFLAQLPEPPDSEIVDTSVQNLIRYGALTQEENLTVLGKQLGILSLPPVLGKALIYSSIFNCVDPILTIVTLFSVNLEIFRNAVKRKEEIRTVKKRFNSNSDHLALYSMYTQWEDNYNENMDMAENFSDDCGLNNLRMLTVKQTKKQYSDQLRQALNTRQNLNSKFASNRFSKNDEMVKAIILAGVDNLVKHTGFFKKHGRIVKSDRIFRDESWKITQTTPESVNHLKELVSSPYLTYIKKTFSAERRTTIIRDSSVISPLTVVLFSQGHTFGYEHPATKLGTDDVEEIKSSKVLIKISDKDNVALMCDEDTASLLFQFRDSIWAVVRYIINNSRQPVAFESEDINIVHRYKDKMLDVLDQLLIVTKKTEDEYNYKRKKASRDPYSVE